MGLWSKITGADKAAQFDAAVAEVRAKFEAEIDPSMFGLPAYSSPVPYASRVSLKTALQVPAVKRADQLVPAVLGTLPAELYGPDKQLAASALLKQPEADVPRSVTFTRLFRDLYFYETAWWRVTERGWHGYPVKVRRLDPTSVRIDTDFKVWYSAAGLPQGVSEERIEDRDLIRFDSPIGGVLDAGARAIRSAALLDRAAENYSTGTPPMEYFTPRADATGDPGEDEDVEDALTTWQTKRLNGGPAYVPFALQYNLGGFNPEQLQLAQARQHAVLELSRVLGVDPEDLGVSTTSRTYFNSQDRRKDKLDFTLGQFRQAVEDRLSMGDVTPGGYYVQFNLSSFLRSDDLTRMQTYAAGLEVGAYTKAQIAELENTPPETGSDAPSPASEPQTQETAVRASIDNVIRANFDNALPIAFEAGLGSVAEVDMEKRTIRGLLVPYGVVGISGGKRWVFSDGSLTWTDPSNVKLWSRHNPDTSMGYAFELESRPDADVPGLYGAFQVDSSKEGTKALQKAKDKAIDGLSIGLHPAREGKVIERNGINFCVSWPLMETSLTPAPVFETSRVHAVAASATNQKEETMKKMTPAQRARLAELRGMDAAKFSADETTEFDTLAALDKEDPAPAAQGNEAPDFSAIGDAVSNGFSAAMEKLGKPLVINAGEGAVSVSEAPLYQFDGLRHDHDFSTDLFQSLKFGDAEASQRIDEFLKAEAPKFAVTVATLNPNKQRPDLYVDQKDYTTPIWDAISKGGLTDATPFVLPKFSSASTLVSDHVTDTEPSDGSLVTTSQTVTPKAMSGKVKIPREVWDQGGSPQLSGLLWNQIMRSWHESLETYAVSILDAASPTAIPLTAGAADEALDAELTSALASLQYVRGGLRMRDLFLQVDLFKKIVGAVDNNGRHLFPMIGAQNANGTAENLFSTVNVGGLNGKPAWALAATGSVVASSYLIDRADVSGWASAPQRITMDQIAVANVYLGVFGYAAAAITDLTGVREITYDPVA